MASAPDALLWDPATLAARLEDEDLVVLDVRRGEAFASGHVPGARNFSVYGINTYDSDPCAARLVHEDVGVPDYGCRHPA